ncbi:MAG: DegV family protein [Chloroflexi bacterium]|nr:DegV family protein [Chloroflexota bacterium]
MPGVRVVTDSTADVPRDFVEKLEISVVPLSVHFGADTYQDGIDLTPGQFFHRLESTSVLPTTSQPSVGAFQEAYGRLGEAGHDIISIHLSSTLSGTYNSALLATQSLPHLTIEVVDSRYVSMAVGWLVIAAAQAALEGNSLPQIVLLVRNMIPRVRLFALLDTLEFVRRGGRIGKASALLGSLLNIKPIILVRDGEVWPSEKVRTRPKALRRLVEMTQEAGTVERLAVVHSNCPDEANELAEILGRGMPRERKIVTEIGPVLGTHVGPGAIGTCFVLAD